MHIHTHSSKRRFGYANQQAIDNGMTGTDCRGEEHEVCIVWSITSGKRQISMDGREVHYSTNRAGMLDFSWQTKGNHVIKVLCHAAPPMSVEPGFRQYDLSIDGQSFFTMPKVFQVGIKGSNNIPGRAQYSSNQQHHPISPVSTGSGRISSRDIPVSREQEEADLRRAIEVSINESRKHLGEIPNGGGGGSVRNSYNNGNNNNNSNTVPEMDLLGFGGPSVIPPPDSRSVASFFSAPTTYGQNYQSPPPPTTGYAGAGAAPAAYDTGGALVPAVAPPGYYQAPPPQQQQQQQQPPSYASPPPPQQQYSYGSPPPVPPAPAPTPNTYYGAPPVHDPFGLHSNMANVNDDPFAPKPPPPPTQQDFASAILASYQTGPGTPLAPTTPGTPHTNGTMNGYGGGASCGVALNMNALAITTVQEQPKSDFEKALSNLVNVDHIDEPAEGEIKLTMIKKEEAKKAPKNGKSIPKPPAGVGMVGSNAPISQIQQNFTSPQNKTSEGIMNAPPPGAFNPNAGNSGALVAYGQGPPPLNQMQGFGVGRMLPNGGMPQQQNLAPGYR